MIIINPQWYFKSKEINDEEYRQTTIHAFVAAIELSKSKDIDIFEW
jgi:hypothetical protein